MDRIDWVIAVRGASLGFTILVINGFLQLLVQRVNAVAGLIWLVLGLLVASVASAWRSGPADSPILTGLVAALFGYSLSVPLLYLAERHIVWRDIALFAALAMAVGALVGHLAGNRHVPDPPSRTRRR
jgi:hypothetical protein